MSRLERFPRRAGVATLVDRQVLSSQLVRVRLQADDFRGAWPIEQPGEVITLLFLPPGEAVVLPTQGWTFPAGAPEQHWRNYTVRRHLPELGAIDVDVVTHEPPGAASAWAVGTPIGGKVGYAGPRVDFAPRADADWLLLCGDETALPAIAAILEQAAPDRQVLAVVEVCDPSAEVELNLPPAAELHWVHRHGAPAATTSHLADALRTLPLPPGPGQAWGAAESTVARELRTVLRDERGLPRTHASAKGYWLRAGEWPDAEE